MLLFLAPKTHHEEHSGRRSQTVDLDHGQNLGHLAFPGSRVEQPVKQMSEQCQSRAVSTVGAGQVPLSGWILC